jgi:hypothetical protein
MADSPQPENQKAIDPLEPWREMRETYMKAWAKTMGEAVNTDEYAKSSGAILETYLSAAAPFRDAQKKVMVSALEQMNMPSRTDFISLAERMTNVELLLDDMDAKLSQIHQLATKLTAQPAPKSAPEAPAPSAVAQPAPKADSEVKPTLVAKTTTHSEPQPPASTPKTEAATKPNSHKTSAKSVTKGSR